MSSAPALILLAAGAGARFGADKRFALLDGRPLMAHALERAAQAPVGAIIIALRPGDEAGAALVAQQLASCPTPWTLAPVARAGDGMAESLKVAIRALPQSRPWAFVALADMPRVRPATYAALAQAIAPGRYAVRPAYNGQPGNPVLLSPEALDDGLTLEGDQGARGLLKRHQARVLRLDLGDPGVLYDVDQPLDLKRRPP
ncbi:MAG: NTP transferase domain-containing protein [Maricaulaceae bacterium]